MKNNSTTFKSIGEKELIISLIKEDLINTRLVCGLEVLGLNSGKYFLRLGEIIFSIMKITDENVMDNYIEKSKQVIHLDIFENTRQLDKLALRLYQMLIKKSKP